MGHVKPGGAAAGPQAVAEDPLWPLWRGLISDFRVGRMVWRMLTTMSGWGLYRLDVASSLKSMPASRDALERLRPVPLPLLDRLAELAEINALRNEALWRMYALFYITVPVTVVLAIIQVAPALMRQFVDDFLPTYGLLTAAATVAMGLQMIAYFGTLWRARQIEAVIGLARLEKSAPQVPRKRATSGTKQAA